MFFKKMEEVKVLVLVPVSCLFAIAGRKPDIGFDCINAFDLNLVECSKHEFYL